jgi:thioredoxin reductase (NADPH)
VALVGGGNSAGQAAVFLSQYAAKVHMMIRGPGLAASMSRYLIDRIEATRNIELCTRCELTQLDGDAVQGLAGVGWRDRERGVEERADVRNVFLFIGASPEAGWLQGCGVLVDDKGFIVTGQPGPSGSARRGTLETSVPGVFAVGDVRSGSVKRVGGAIGEGAAVVALIHQHLAALDAARAA